MQIEYIQAGEYLLPNLKLRDPPDAPPLRLYGELHKRYLCEHKPILYNKLLLTERLYPLRREVDESAAERLRTITDREMAHEIILSELIYT